MYEYTGVRDLFLISIAEFESARRRNSAQRDADLIIEAFEGLHFKCPTKNRLIGNVTLQGRVANL